MKAVLTGRIIPANALTQEANRIIVNTPAIYGMFEIRGGELLQAPDGQFVTVTIETTETSEPSNA